MDVLVDLCGKITYEFCEEGKALMNYGEFGDTFYIVLDGCVGVEIPMHVDREDQEIDEIIFTEVAKKGKGEAFGELSLITDQPRSATIRAKIDTHLAVLNKASYNAICGSEDIKHINFIITVLAKCPMFAGWTKGSLLRLSYFFSRRQFKRHQYVYHENEPLGDIFIIVSGDFKLSKKIRVARKRVIQGDITLLGPGEMFGDGKDARISSCQCMSQLGELLAITRDNFFRRIQNSESWKWYNSKLSAAQRWRKQRVRHLSDFAAAVRGKHGRKLSSGLEGGMSKSFDDQQHQNKGRVKRLTAPDRDQVIDKYLRRIHSSNQSLRRPMSGIAGSRHRRNLSYEDPIRGTSGTPLLRSFFNRSQLHRSRDQLNSARQPPQINPTDEELEPEPTAHPQSTLSVERTIQSLGTFRGTAQSGAGSSVQVKSVPPMYHGRMPTVASSHIATDELLSRRRLEKL